jgi:hypothetical protein
MRATFISFARLPPGSYFDARGDTWIKCNGVLTGDDNVRFNAYHSEFDHLGQNDMVTTQIFPDEMLVKYDPDEPRVDWSALPDL